MSTRGRALEAAAALYEAAMAPAFREVAVHFAGWTDDANRAQAIHVLQIRQQFIVEDVEALREEARTVRQTQTIGKLAEPYNLNGKLADHMLGIAQRLVAAAKMLIEVVECSTAESAAVERLREATQALRLVVRAARTASNIETIEP